MPRLNTNEEIFSADDIDNLKRFVENKCDDKSPFGLSADKFVELLRSEAQWAQGELAWLKTDGTGTKDDIKDELCSLLGHVERLESGLRNLSPVSYRLLPVECDPATITDNLNSLSKQLNSALESAKELQRFPRTDQKQHNVALELVRRVEPILEQFGLPLYATYDSNFKYISDSVRILKTIGDCMKLVLSEVTWRDIVVKSRSPQK